MKKAIGTARRGIKKGEIIIFESNSKRDITSDKIKFVPWGRKILLAKISSDLFHKKFPFGHTL